MEDKRKPEKKPVDIVTDVAKLQAAIDRQVPISGTFVVGERKHYRAGKLYEAGDLITIVNEKPSRTWTPYDSSPRRADRVPAPAPSALNLDLEA